MEDRKEISVAQIIPVYADTIFAGQKIRKIFVSLGEGYHRDRVNMIAAGIASIQLQIAGYMNELEDAGMLDLSE